MTEGQELLALLRAGSHDVARATVQSSRATSRLVAVGYEPLEVTIENGPPVGKHWVVSQLIAFGNITDPAKVIFPPVAVGFSIVQLGQQSETLDQAQAGINYAARGQLLANISYAQALDDGTVEWESFAQGALNTPLSINSGFTVRYSMNQDPGTATPGPGPGSFLVMQMLYSEEDDAISPAPPR